MYGLLCSGIVPVRPGNNGGRRNRSVQVDPDFAAHNERINNLLPDALIGELLHQHAQGRLLALEEDTALLDKVVRMDGNAGVPAEELDVIQPGLGPDELLGDGDELVAVLFADQRNDPGELLVLLRDGDRFGLHLDDLGPAGDPLDEDIGGIPVQDIPDGVADLEGLLAVLGHVRIGFEQIDEIFLQLRFEPNRLPHLDARELADHLPTEVCGPPDRLISRVPHDFPHHVFHRFLLLWFRAAPGDGPISAKR